jgi:hypothetical protein
METVTVTYQTFKFNELSEKAQQRVLEKLYDINVFDDWHECTISDWVEKLDAIGFEKAKIAFSGFCSQGDGASFDATINLEKIIKHLDNKKFNRLLSLVKPNVYMLGMHIESNSYSYHYCHEHTKRVEMSLDLDDRRYRRLSNLCDELLEAVEELRLDLSHDIYSELGKEYEYLTSEKAIKESIEANEYTFLEDGKLFS